MLYECEQAEIYLAQLQEKARSLAESLRDVCGLLEYNADVSREYKPGQPDMYKRAGKTIDLDNPRYQEAMELAKVKTLMSDVTETKQRVHSLRERKKLTR